MFLFSQGSPSRCSVSWAAPLMKNPTQLENPVDGNSVGAFKAAPFVGDVVLENMYEDEVRKLISKTPLEIITVLEGTGKVSLQARFRSVQNGGPFGSPVYECELTDDSAEALGGIARGMSGSPVGTLGACNGCSRLRIHV